MKSRKWLFVTAFAASIYNLKLLRPDKVESVIAVVALTDSVIRWSLFGGLLYLLVLYIALSAQLYLVYDLVLAERLRFRKDGEISSAQLKVDDAKREVIRLDDLKAQTNAIPGVQIRTSRYSEQEHDAATAIYNRNVVALQKILKSDPSDRRFFREIEVVVDLVRVLGPIFVSIVALYFLVRPHA